MTVVYRVVVNVVALEGAEDGWPDLCMDLNVFFLEFWPQLWAYSRIRQEKKMGREEGTLMTWQMRFGGGREVMRGTEWPGRVTPPSKAKFEP